MSEGHFLKQPLPFAECRYSKNSGRYYKPHMHKTFCMGAVEQGEVIYLVEGKSASLSIRLSGIRRINDHRRGRSGAGSPWKLNIRIATAYQYISWNLFGDSFPERRISKGEMP